ncbi:MAG: MFS transporter [Acidimicrobiales bacterium]|jgi:predicted MFS family arabinose efflux permease
MRLDRWIGALSERNFRLYFIGRLTSSIGTSMTPVALSFAVLTSDHSVSDLGYVLTAGTVPLVVFLLVGGVLADRLGRRRVMLASDVLRAASQSALAVWVLTGHVPLWGFMALSAVVGTGTAFFSPSMIGLIPEVASAERLPQANALNGLTSSVGGIVGPSIAGIIVAAASPGWAIAGDALSYVVSVASLVALQLPPGSAKTAESYWHQLKAGWTGFWERTWLWAIVVQWSVGNAILFAPYYVLGAEISKTSLGGATAWGTILAAQGAGALFGGLVMLRLRFRRPLLAGTMMAVMFLPALLSLAYSRSVPLIAACSFLGGTQLACFGAIWDTTMQREIPAEMLSRLSAYDWFGSLVFLPIGYAIVGPVSQVIGIRTTFVAGCVYCLVAAAAVLCIPTVRRLRWTAPPTTEAEAAPATP